MLRLAWLNMFMNKIRKTWLPRTFTGSQYADLAHYQAFYRAIDSVLQSSMSHDDISTVV